MTVIQNVLILKTLRAADHIVAHAWKGNETIVQENKQMRALVLDGSDASGAVAEVKTLARVSLNEVTKEKGISKQERTPTHLSSTSWCFVLKALNKSAHLELASWEQKIKQAPGHCLSMPIMKTHRKM